MKSINVTNNKIKYLLIPIIIVVAGIVMYFVQGFNFDIEFMGGIKMQVDMGTPFSNEEVSSYLEEKTGVTPIIVQTVGGGTQASIKTQPIEEEKKNEIYSLLKEKYNLQADEPMSVTSASASFGNKVQKKAFVYTLIAILCILAYIAIRFEWRSAITAIVALVINILVMMAVYVISYTPLNTTFIAAMLTVIGYSINNTIVVFDRIRENMKGYNPKKGETISEITNRSINESMGRTINTTLTTLITIIVLYIVGVPSIKEFAFPLIVGVLAGAYSSIFIASPWWASWKESDEEAKKQKK